MDYWRNDIEQKFWIEMYQDFIRRDVKRADMKQKQQITLFKAELANKGYKVSVTQNGTLLVDIPDPDYMYMFLIHE